MLTKTYFASAILFLFWCTNIANIGAQNDAASRTDAITVPNVGYIVGQEIGGVKTTNGGTNDPNNPATTPTFAAFMYLSACSSQQIGYRWAFGNTVTDVTTVVKHNGTIISMQSNLSANGQGYLAPPVNLYVNDSITIEVIPQNGQTAPIKLNYRYIPSLNIQQAAPNQVQPIATVEQIHPRKRRAQFARSSISSVISSCNWLQDSLTNAPIYYLPSEVLPCISTPNLTDAEYRACLDNATKYITFNPYWQSCIANNGVQSRESDKRRRMETIVVSVSPNPFSSAINLNYFLTEASEVNFNLTDAMGKTVLTRTFALQGEGTNSINIGGLALPKGIYFYTLRANTGSAAGRILKTED